jgi:hypothetical protein
VQDRCWQVSMVFKLLPHVLHLHYVGTTLWALPPSVSLMVQMTQPRHQA